MSTASSTRSRRTRQAAALVAATAATVAGCSGDDDDDPAGSPNVIVLSGDVTEEALADAFDAMGESVDDVEIVFGEGSGSISVGGLPLTLGALADYVAVETNFLVPPTWWTLRRRALVHRTEPFAALPVTWVVFAQTVAVTDDELRAAVEHAHWRLAGLADVEPSHRSTVVADGVTCRTEIRVERSESFGDLERGHVLFAGPGLASSAVVVAGTPSTPTVAAMLGDAVESACGTRPAGL